ncbi:hypothetical protein XH96_32415 [Bradyrhizobium sp. CCBAU 51765]|nr:hypothetical protein XH96_32415 [Bradyrhizobium sp. CCBAU 51765]
MSRACGGPRRGGWDWKLAYEGCEAATALFLRKYGKALFRKVNRRTSRDGNEKPRHESRGSRHATAYIRPGQSDDG